MYLGSKAAQRNRRKKQQQQRNKQQQDLLSGRSQEQRDAVSVATHLMGGASVSGRSEGGEGGSASGDMEKKIKNLKKVCCANKSIW